MTPDDIERIVHRMKTDIEGTAHSWLVSEYAQGNEDVEFTLTHRGDPKKRMTFRVHIEQLSGEEYLDETKRDFLRISGVDLDKGKITNMDKAKELLKNIEKVGRASSGKKNDKIRVVELGEEETQELISALENAGLDLPADIRKANKAAKKSRRDKKISGESEVSDDFIKSLFN